jgi:thiamine biosynthesis lipoprotein
MLSTWRDDSELSRVNRGEREASGELHRLLLAALQWSSRTGGAFDPRLGRLIELWGLRNGGAVPDSNAVRAALPPNDPHPRFEEGGFGKGYALDRMLSRVRGDAMIDFGGQVIVRGAIPVRIADPANRERPVARFTLRDASVSTSSGSEKTFEAADRRYSHILDPRTGEALPPRGSVSVIADDALTADILSTAVYVMGEEAGIRWADANDVAVIFINPSNRIRLSAAARSRVRDLEVLDSRFTRKD